VQQDNCPAVRMTLPTWLDHLVESYSYKEVQFKKFCPCVKTSLSPAENINKSLIKIAACEAASAPVEERFV